MDFRQVTERTGNKFAPASLLVPFLVESMLFDGGRHDLPSGFRKHMAGKILYESKFYSENH